MLFSWILFNQNWSQSEILDAASEVDQATCILSLSLSLSFFVTTLPLGCSHIINNSGCITLLHPRGGSNDLLSSLLTPTLELWKSSINYFATFIKDVTRPWFPIRVWLTYNVYIEYCPHKYSYSWIYIFSGYCWTWGSTISIPPGVTFQLKLISLSNR